MALCGLDLPVPGEDAGRAGQDLLHHEEQGQADGDGERGNQEKGYDAAPGRLHRKDGCDERAGDELQDEDLVRREDEEAAACQERLRQLLLLLPVPGGQAEGRADPADEEEELAEAAPVFGDA